MIEWILVITLWSSGFAQNGNFGMFIPNFATKNSCEDAAREVIIHANVAGNNANNVNAISAIRATCISRDNLR